MPDCTKGHERHCREAKGPASECECLCGGRNHGRDNPESDAQVTAKVQAGPKQSNEPSIPCVRHSTREATTVTPNGQPVCDHCADVLGIKKGER